MFFKCVRLMLDVFYPTSNWSDCKLIYIIILAPNAHNYFPKVLAVVCPPSFLSCVSRLTDIRTRLCDQNKLLKKYILLASDTL